MNLLEAVTLGFAEIKGELKTFFATREKLEAELASTRSELAIAKNALAGAVSAKDDLQGKLDAQAPKIAELQSQITAKDGEITALKAAAVTASEEAAKIIAGAGIPIAKLPAAGAGQAASKEQEVQSLRTQIQASNDPKEKYKLAMQIRQIQTGQETKK